MVRWGAKKKEMSEKREQARASLSALVKHARESFKSSFQKLSRLLSHMTTCTQHSHSHTHTHTHTHTLTWKGWQEDEKEAQRAGGDREDVPAAISWAWINRRANVAATYGSPLRKTVLPPPERMCLIFHNLLQHGISVTALPCRAALQLGGGSLQITQHYFSGQSCIIPELYCGPNRSIQIFSSRSHEGQHNSY